MQKLCAHACSHRLSTLLVVSVGTGTAAAGDAYSGMADGIDARCHTVRNPECRGCIRFMKAELEEKSPTFRLLNNLVGKTFTTLRDARVTREERDEAKLFAREAMDRDNR